MWSVVNEAGTATGIKMAGFEIAGKTGTAQVVSLGKYVGEHKDHSWFVSYAPAFKPEISCVALIENAGLGSRFGAPTVRAVYDAYYRQTRHEEPSAVQIAKTKKPAAIPAAIPTPFVPRAKYPELAAFFSSFACFTLNSCSRTATWLF